MVILFIFTVSTRYNLNKSEVDLTTYHLNIEHPKSFLIQQKDIITYNQKENILSRINIIFGSNGKLTQYTVKTNLPNIEIDLKNLNCDEKDIQKCIEKNILKTKGYIVENENKAYLLNKEFGLKLYDIVSKYDKKLKNKKN